ncbi:MULTISPECIES: hypothetical protein [Streptomyces]|uniref:DUF2178 domain-containing protein n=1 Tax=Streptomyces spororaveus TaxID=284039 RepID=A0ABQ3TPS1_9ACTN|nr:MULTISPECIES: hypothetical protein [Streptomyces]MCX5308900.1 hypothetical protein [Streptomyces sp. NBC_00160]GHI82399.1 hypothetical protein Sspor_79600 [Streptomyces spororaveus]
MAVEEKRAWIMIVVTVVSYGAYLAVILGGSGKGPLAEQPYAAALLWTVGAAIVASIALHITVALLSPEEGRVKDQRDREIHQFGEHIGQSFVAIGAVTGMILAMAEADQFWIANAIYLGFVLSALLASTAKIASYRMGFHPW